MTDFFGLSIKSNQTFILTAVSSKINLEIGFPWSIYAGISINSMKIVGN